MVTVDVAEARGQLKRLLDRVEAGEEFVIARDGDPVARLISAKPLGTRRFGALKGRLAVGDSFFDPLPDDELAAWGQSSSAASA